MHRRSSVVGRLEPVDTRALWSARVVPDDQFLLYGFVGVVASVEEATARILRRARVIDDLCIRVMDVPADLDHPRWVRTEVHSDDAIRVHGCGDWAGCLATVGAAMADQVEPRRLPWRVHLFPTVAGAPRGEGQRVTVVVVQVSHALADGTLASELARRLLDDTGPEPDVRIAEYRDPRPLLLAAEGVARLPMLGVAMVTNGSRAYRAHRRRVRDESAGQVPSRPDGVPRTSVNVAPGERRDLRVVPTDAVTLRAIGRTVTVGALSVIGGALADHLGATALRAEVLAASPGERHARNHFRTVGVDLAVDESDPARRATRIADDLAAAIRRARHPAVAAEAAATRAVPAPLLAWGVRQCDPDVVPSTVSGNTVVSSVNRGGELVFGGGRAVLTAGFPALSPVQSVTHGVHGIDGRVALAVCSSPTGLPDPDAYAERLAAALG